MATPVERPAGILISEEDRPPSITGSQTHSRSRAASVTSGRSGTQRPPLHERLSKSNWTDKTTPSRLPTSTPIPTYAAQATPGSKAPPWSEFEDEGGPQTGATQTEVGSAPSGHLQANYAIPYSLGIPSHTTGPSTVPSREATFPSFRTLPQNPLYTAPPQTNVVNGHILPLHGIQRNEHLFPTQDVHRIVADELATYDHSIQLTVKTELRRHLTHYVDVWQIQVLQDEFTRLRTLVVDLRQELNRPKEVHRRHAPVRRGVPHSDREKIPSGINSEEDEYRQELAETDLRNRTRLRRHVRPRPQRTSAVSGLLELEPSYPRFTDILLYRRYRLANQDGRFGPDVSRNIGICSRRLEHAMGRHTFNGSNHVACLRFMSVFKKQLGNEALPE